MNAATAVRTFAAVLADYNTVSAELDAHMREANRLANSRNAVEHARGNAMLASASEIQARLRALSGEMCAAACAGRM